MKLARIYKIFFFKTYSFLEIDVGSCLYRTEDLDILNSIFDLTSEQEIVELDNGMHWPRDSHLYGADVLEVNFLNNVSLKRLSFIFSAWRLVIEALICLTFGLLMLGEKIEKVWHVLCIQDIFFNAYNSARMAALLDGN